MFIYHRSFMIKTTNHQFITSLCLILRVFVLGSSDQIASTILYFLNTVYKGSGNARASGKYVNLCFIILEVARLIPVIIITSRGVYWHARHHFSVECVSVKISGYVRF